jgi:hypothetical protein
VGFTFLLAGQTLSSALTIPEQTDAVT